VKPSELLELKAKQSGIEYPQMTVTELLEKNNGGHLDDVAIKYYGNNITYEQLFKKIDEYNRAFASYGIQKGDYVSVCLPTIPESIYIFFALNKIGAKFHTILPTATTEQIVEILQHNKSKMFITLDSLYYRVGEAIQLMDVPYKVKVSANNSLPPIIKQIKQLSDLLKKETYKNIPLDFLAIKQFLKNGNGYSTISNPWKSGDIAAVTNSSGSTARNKGTKLTDYGFNAMVCNYQKALTDVHRGQSFHSCIPVLYSTGLSNSVNLPLQLGLPTILEPIFDKNVYPERFMKNKPNLSIVPVPHAKALLDYLRKVYKENNAKNKDMLSFVDVFSVGGSHMPIPWEEELGFYLEYYGSSSAIGKGYGLSEHNSALTISTKKMIGAAGIVLPGVIFGIFDSVTGEELDFGQEGQIRAISPCDMAGYFNNEALNEAYFQTDENGKRWGHTGDIGRLELIDGEVWLFYSGREKEIININGNDILLPKIQAKIFECDLIDDCELVVIKQDDDNHPVAHIVLKNGSISAEEILKKLHELFKNHENLEPYAYKIHDSLPVLISGKVDKPLLSSELNDYIKHAGERVKNISFY
jgi:long-chain acyl-CoA synthetase